MLPSKIVAGDSVKFSVQPFTDLTNRTISFPEWTAKLSIRGNGVSLDATADSGWNFSIPASATLSLAVGVTYFQVYAENPTTLERQTMNNGRLEILPNLNALASSTDNRSQTQKDLESVQALIRSLISTGGVAEYAIGNRKMRKYDLAELRIEESKLLSRLAREQSAERIDQGLGNPHAKFVRFK